MNIEIKKSVKPVNYSDAINIMEERLEQIFNNKEKELIWTLEHEEIYTAGTSYNETDIIDKSIKIIETNRGGKITCHGPGAAEIILVAPPVIIVFALVKGLALFAQTVMVNALALRVSTDLQKDMAKNLIEADLQTITREPAGVFMSRIMNDLNLVREAFVRLANNLVRWVCE